MSDCPRYNRTVTPPPVLTPLISLDSLDYLLRKRFFDLMSFHVTAALYNNVPALQEEIKEQCGYPLNTLNCVVTDPPKISRVTKDDELFPQVYIRDIDRKCTIRTSVTEYPLMGSLRPETCIPGNVYLEARSKKLYPSLRVYRVPDDMKQLMPLWKKMYCVHFEQMYFERDVFDRICHSSLNTLMFFECFMEPIPKLIELVERFTDLRLLNLHLFDMAITHDEFKEFVALQEKYGVLKHLVLHNIKMENDTDTVISIFRLCLANKGCCMLYFKTNPKLDLNMIKKALRKNLAGYGVLYDERKKSVTLFNPNNVESNR